jgi:Holliday junction resolvasome RuvABC endonuclease subunit
MEADYLGIDPGLSGGFAVVSGDSIRYKMVMPTISFNTKDDKTKTELDREGILSFLTLFPKHVHVVIEKQEAFRGQDITSSCTICRNYGILLMGLTAAHFYITEVPSDIWQDHFGIVSVRKSQGQSTKQQAFHIAQRLYPIADFRKSKRSHIVHDGIVDAVLIANYCQSLFAPFHEPPTGVQLVSTRDETPVEIKKQVVRSGGTESRTKLERRQKEKKR